MTPSATITMPVQATTGMLALDRLDPDHWPNPRGIVDTTSAAFLELQESIREQGMLEPIVVGPALDELDGRHPIIAGWRRYTAAREASTIEVPVHHRADITDARAALRAALAENLAREDMTPLAEARAIAQLVELGDTQVQAAGAVGVSERTARERLRLLDLPAKVRDAVEAGTVPTTCTRQLQLVADVCPKASIELVKQITAGNARALDLADPDRLARLLRAMDIGKVALVELRHGVELKSLKLPAAVAKDLLARANKAAQYGGGSYLDLRPGEVGKKVLDAAQAAGKLLQFDLRERDDHVTFIVDAKWIEAAARASVEKAERSAKLRAKRVAEAAKGDQPVDPVAVARAKRDASAKALDKRARPNAAAMNAEIGRRLRGLTSCALEGSVGRLVMHLAAGASGVDIERLAKEVYAHVDPVRSLPGDWHDQDPAAAAAELVCVCVGATFADPRAPKGPLCDLPYFILQPGGQAFTGLVRGIAATYELVPDRAIALLDARLRLVDADRYHARQDARRRILFELDELPEGEWGAAGRLREATESWRKDFGDRRGISANVWQNQRHDAALDDLVRAGDVVARAAPDRSGEQQYVITTGGREILNALPEQAPVIDDLDDGVVEMQLVEEPVHDTGELTIVLEQPETSVPARSRRARVLELIGAHPGIRIAELAHGMAVKPPAIERVVMALIKDDLITAAKVSEGRGLHLVEPPASAAAGDDVAATPVVAA